MNSEGVTQRRKDAKEDKRIAYLVFLCVFASLRESFLFFQAPQPLFQKRHLLS